MLFDSLSCLFLLGVPVFGFFCVFSVLVGLVFFLFVMASLGCCERL